MAAPTETYPPSPNTILRNHVLRSLEGIPGSVPAPSCQSLSDLGNNRLTHTSRQSQSHGRHSIANPSGGEAGRSYHPPPHHHHHHHHHHESSTEAEAIRAAELFFLRDLPNSELQRKRLLFRNRPFSSKDGRDVVSVCSSKEWQNDGIPQMFHAAQETNRILSTFSQRKLTCLEQKRNFELKRNGASKLPSLPPEVTLHLELQGSEFANILAGDVNWCNHSTDNLFKIQNDFPECDIVFSDHIDLDDILVDTFNHASIQAMPESIETIRHRLTGLAPLVVCLPIVKKDPAVDLAALLDAWIPRELAAYSMVQIYSSSLPADEVEGHIRCIHGIKPGVPHNVMNSDDFVVLKAAAKDAGRLIDAALLVEKFIYGHNCESRCFATMLEIPSTLDHWVLGPLKGLLMRLLSTKFRARVMFPSVGDDAINKDAVFVRSYFFSGRPGAIVNALQAFYKILPIRMTFDAEHSALKMPPGLEFNPANRCIDFYDLEEGLLFEFRPSRFDFNDSTHMRHQISITTANNNMLSLYRAYAGLTANRSFGPLLDRKNTDSDAKLYRKFLLDALFQIIQSNSKVQDAKVENPCNMRFITMPMNKLPNPRASSYKGCLYESLINAPRRSGRARLALECPLPQMTAPSTPLQFIFAAPPQPHRSRSPVGMPDAFREGQVAGAREIQVPNSERSCKIVTKINETNIHLPPAHLRHLQLPLSPRNSQSQPQGAQVPYHHRQSGGNGTGGGGNFRRGSHAAQSVAPTGYRRFLNHNR